MTTVDRDESILNLYGEGHSRGHIASIVSCSIQTVSRVLLANGIGPAWQHDPDEQGDPPRPGEPEMKKGDCLVCKKGTYTHPHWPDGKCPVCKGTGRYPEKIMHPVQRWRCPSCGKITTSKKQPTRCCGGCLKRVRFEEI
jgi:hypothetical protein